MILKLPHLSDDYVNISEKEFYEFTEENIKASKVVEWYALWTMQQSNASAWQKNGEWAAFFKDHLGEPNFMCTLGNDGCLVRFQIWHRVTGRDSSLRGCDVSHKP